MTTKTILRRALITAGVLGLASLGLIYYQNAQVPTLGVSDGKFKPLGSFPKGVSTQASQDSKKVEPLPMKASVEETVAALKEACNSVCQTDILEERSDYLRLVFTTPVMKFHDDGEFWIDDKARVVHFRSEARAGYSDGGNNRARYQKIRRAYGS